MHRQADPLTHDIVLIGGGHTHALVLHQFAMEPLKGAALTLISPDPTTPYTGMLPGHIAGHYTRDEIEIDLVRLARKAGARLILDRAIGLDREGRFVQTAGGRQIGYDVLSFDIGVTAPPPDIRGVELGHAVRPLARFADAFGALLNDVSPGQQIALLVVGGGLGGVELALAMQHAVTAKGATPDVTLIDRGKVLKDQATPVRRALVRALSAKGVKVQEHVELVGLSDGLAETTQGEIRCDFALFATGAAPQDWLRGTGLNLHKGFISVGPTLQSLTDDRIFATGDCAHLSFAPRPKAGVFAVRQAPVLAQNLRALIRGNALSKYRPQRDYLKLVSLGEKRALAHRHPLHLTAKRLWDWKDRIDRAFMEKFAAPGWPAVPDELLCAGCGSKVGRGVLAGILPETTGDDAAVVGVHGGEQVLTTDHLRAFSLDVGLMAQAAAVHALGDIWAMGARPQSALMHLILPEMSAGLQVRRLAEITEAAQAVFRPEGVALVGGHTTQGAEFTIGFTLTGLPYGPVRRLSGALPGDALILTKPLGAGVLLAAEMRGLARARDVAALLAMMLRPQGKAAHLLAKAAHAMTDVTGFGLAGHLWAMCKASHLGAEIRLNDLPVYEGAADLAAKGMRSSIFATNFADAPVSGPAGARFDLLFDPQTCGGLLAAVPAERAEALVQQIRGIGLPATCIGRMTASDDLRAI
jgi:selenide, water dikinase